MKKTALMLLSVLAVAAYTAFVLTFPEKLDVKYAPKDGWDVDSGSYFGFTQTLLGEDNEGYFRETGHRPVYPALAALPYLITKSKLAMLVPVFLSAVGLPLVLFMFLRESGLSEETSAIMAVLLLFSRVFAFYGAVALADIPALFFGVLAMLFWKRGENLNSALIMSIAILTRETNLLFLAAVLAHDLAKGRLKKEFILPVMISLLLVGSYVKFFERAHGAYSADVPEDSMGLGERAGASVTTFMATFGMVALFALLGWTPDVSMNMVLLGNVGMQLAWQSVHKRFWLPAFLPMVYFAGKWVEKRSRNEKLVVAGFVILADAMYSVVPGAIAAIF